MKILLISEYYPSSNKLDVHGGVEVRSYYIASYLARKHQVTVLAANESNKPIRQIISQVKVIRIGYPRKYTRTGKLARLNFILAGVFYGIKIDFDLVEGAGFWGTIIAYFLGIIKNKPKIAVVADVITAYADNINIYTLFLLKTIEQFILSRPWDKIICISNTVKNKVLQLNVSETKIVTIYCGIDNARLSQIKAIKYQIPTLCTISRLVPYKRVQDLITAISIISRGGIKINCEIIGDGEQLNKLKQITADFGLLNQIKFHGFIIKHQDVLKILKKCHIYCSTSIAEGFGIATVEAFALGLPAVVTEMQVNREISNNQGVLFYQPLNCDDLANKIMTLLNDSSLYKKLTKEAKQNALLYDWQGICQQTEKLYENMRSY